jgi:hypothetical protein
MCKQRFGALCWCQTNQARVWVYLTTKGWLWCGGWVRCGYILHPSFSLVLGLVLRERIRCKGKGVKITNLNLDIPYHTGILYSSCVNKSTPTCRFSTQSIKRSTISLPLNMAPCWGTIIYKECLVCMNFFRALNLVSSSGSSSMGI